MNGRKRIFRDATEACRCKATITLRDGSKAQCGRWNRPGFKLCTQHLKIESARPEGK